jgi:hypothetical protein
VALSLLASALWYLAHKGDMALLFNADSDYLPMLYRDLFQHGGSLAQWNLTPAPSFFPDWPLFFLARKLAGSLFYAVPGFFVLQGVLLFALSAHLACSVVARRAAIVAAAWCTVLVYWWAFGTLVPYSYFYLSAFHCGMFLLLLGSLSLIHAASVAAWRPAHAALLVLAALATLSDRLYVLQCAVPAVATLFLLQRRGQPWWRLCLAMAAGVLIGMALYQQPALVARPLLLPWEMSLDAVPGNLRQLQELLALTWRSTQLGTIGLLAYYLVLSLLLPGTLLGIGWRLPQGAAARLALFNWLCAAASLAALLLSTQPVTVRYLIPFYVLPLLCGPVLLYAVLAPRWRTGLSAVLLTASTGLTLAMLWPALQLMPQLQREYYPDDVACMDRALAPLAARHGVAIYWDAKRVELLSRQEVTIAAYHPSLDAWHWINSEADFRPAYDFVLARRTDGLNTDELMRLNGAPTLRVSCSTFDVLVYPPGGLQRGFKP